MPSIRFLISSCKPRPICQSRRTGVARNASRDGARISAEISSAANQIAMRSGGSIWCKRKRGLGLCFSKPLRSPRSQRSSVKVAPIRITTNKVLVGESLPCLLLHQAAPSASSYSHRQRLAMFRSPAIFFQNGPGMLTVRLATCASCLPFRWMISRPPDSPWLRQIESCAYN